MIELKEANGVDPVCPHCDAVIAELWFRELRGFFGKRYLYFCCKCNKVLGVSHRKGFFMG